MLLNEIYKELLSENVSLNKINDAIDNTYEVMINYHSNGEDIATGERVIQPVAYGLTKSGNPVIRAFQPYGDTTSKVPSWKFFRIDRITFWKGLYNNKFKEPPGTYNAEGNFNENGDKSMSIVYKIANFNNAKNKINYDNIGAVTKSKVAPNVYKTDVEKGIEHLRKQLENPTYITNNSGPLTKDGENVNNNGPILKSGNIDNNTNDNVYKTDTEKRLEQLKKQLENPTYISDIIKNNNFGPEINKSDIGPKYK